MPKPEKKPFVLVLLYLLDLKRGANHKRETLATLKSKEVLPELQAGYSSPISEKHCTGII